MVRESSRRVIRLPERFRDSYVEEPVKKTKLYCTCRRPHTPNKFMICCDECREWFHGECVNLTEEQAKDIEKYMCPVCRGKRGSLAADTPETPSTTEEQLMKEATKPEQEKDELAPPELWCTSCNKKGHLQSSRLCPLYGAQLIHSNKRSAATDPAAGVVRCTACDMEGHTHSSRECPLYGVDQLDEIDNLFVMEHDIKGSPLHSFFPATPALDLENPTTAGPDNSALPDQAPDLKSKTKEIAMPKVDGVGVKTAASVSVSVRMEIDRKGVQTKRTIVEAAQLKVDFSRLRGGVHKPDGEGKKKRKVENVPPVRVPAKIEISSDSKGVSGTPKKSGKALQPVLVKEESQQLASGNLSPRGSKRSLSEANDLGPSKRQTMAMPFGSPKKEQQALALAVPASPKDPEAGVRQKVRESLAAALLLAVKDKQQGASRSFSDTPKLGNLEQEMTGADPQAESAVKGGVNKQEGLALGAERHLEEGSLEPREDLEPASAREAPAGAADGAAPEGHADVAAPARLADVAAASTPGESAKVAEPAGAAEVAALAGAADAAVPARTSDLAAPEGVADVAAPAGASGWLAPGGTNGMAVPPGTAEVAASAAEKPSEVEVDPAEEKRAGAVAEAIEAEMFETLGGTSKKYKLQYRSLVFNLKDKANPDLRARVLAGDITPQQLVRMSPDEMASKQLSEWRQHKQEEMDRMIVLTEDPMEALRRVTKKTHKGEVEIEHKVAPKVEVGRPSKGDVEEDKPKEKDEKPRVDKAKLVREALAKRAAKQAAQAKLEPKGEESKHSDTEGMSIDAYMAACVAAGEGFEEPVEEEPKSTGFVSDEEIELLSDDEAPPKKAQRETAPVMWEGKLELSASKPIPVRCYHRAGDSHPLEDVPGPLHVKGRLKLGETEAFLDQVVRFSRSRVTTVTSVQVWEDAARELLGGTHEAEKHLSAAAGIYSANARTGFAEPKPGVELYILPSRTPVVGRLVNALAACDPEKVMRSIIEQGHLAGVFVKKKLQESAKTAPHKALQKESRSSGASPAAPIGSPTPGAATWQQQSPTPKEKRPPKQKDSPPPAAPAAPPKAPTAEQGPDPLVVVSRRHLDPRLMRAQPVAGEAAPELQPMPTLAPAVAPTVPTPAPLPGPTAAPSQKPREPDAHPPKSLTPGNPVAPPGRPPGAPLPPPAHQATQPQPPPRAPPATWQRPGMEPLFPPRPQAPPLEDDLDDLPEFTFGQEAPQPRPPGGHGGYSGQPRFEPQPPPGAPPSQFAPPPWHQERMHQIEHPTGMWRPAVEPARQGPAQSGPPGFEQVPPGWGPQNMHRDPRIAPPAPPSWGR